MKPRNVIMSILLVFLCVKAIFVDGIITASTIVASSATIAIICTQLYQYVKSWTQKV